MSHAAKIDVRQGNQTHSSSFCKFTTHRNDDRTGLDMNNAVNQMHQIDENLRRSYQVSPSGALPENLAGLLARLESQDLAPARDEVAATPEPLSGHVPTNQSCRDRPRSPVERARNLIQRYGFAWPQNQDRRR